MMSDDASSSDYEGLLEGFDTASWEYVECFKSHVASPDDMHNGSAVFAVADSFSSQTITMDLPQPAMWHSSAGAIPVLIVQAERHKEFESSEAEELFGVLMPNGSSAVTTEAYLDWVDGEDEAWLDAIDDLLDALSEGDEGDS
jgi:hypothetical protein